MITPFIINNNTNILTKKALIILMPAMVHTSMIFGPLKYNLIFGKFYQYVGHLSPYGAVDIAEPTADNISEHLEYYYYSSIKDVTKPTIYLDLERIYNMYTNTFDSSLIFMFLHEFCHVYQRLMKLYDMEDCSIYGKTQKEYDSLPWEADANLFASMFTDTLRRKPFTIIDKKGNLLF